MLKRAKLVSLMLLAGAAAVPVSAFADIVPDRASVNLSQQDGKVTCTVEDALGPVPGASVIIKGTTNGNVTDMDGKVVLEGVKNGDVIQVSFIGYATQEITYTGQSTLAIVLKEDAQALEEVVVVGYGTQKKENLTGAVAAVAGDVLENRPITNIGQGLQGVVPNLQVNVSSGAPGQSSSFQIRGNSSLNGGSPLVLVDNVQMDPNLVNPDDIASISVLKDAASAAIYGARAAYGVILITTKKGKTEQKPQISVSASGYWQSPAVRVHNVNSVQYLEMYEQAAANSGESSGITQALRDHVYGYYNGTYKYTEFFDNTTGDANKWQYCGNTDWFNELYKTSFSQQYNVNISGGDSKTTYYASVGFADQNGILKSYDDNYKKFNANLNLSSQLTKWLQVSAKISHNYSTEDHPVNSSSAGISTYGGMLKNDLSPYMPVYHSHTGQLVYTPGADPINDEELGIKTNGDYVYVEDGQRHHSGQNSYTNPYAVGAYGGYTKYKVNDLWMTGAVKITPLEGLVINADYTFNFYNKGTSQVQNTFLDYQAVAGTEATYTWTNPSYALYGNNEDYYSAFNAFVEYSKSFADNSHNFKVMAGYNQEKKDNKYFEARRNDLIVESIPDLDLATGDRTMTSSDTGWAINGFFFRLNYNYQQKYLLEVNGRYDGSSKFADGHRYAFFPSVSAAWRVSGEKFWDPIRDWWDDLKIRGSYGSLGNQVVDDLGNFPYLATYGVNSNYNYLLGGSRPVVITAPGLVAGDFTWETVNQMNFGFDATLLSNRLTGSFDWYRRNTTDMLIPGATLPATLGADVPRSNSADMKTVGWELSLTWNDRLENGLSYWFKGVLSDYLSTITKYSGNDAKLYADNANYEGKKIGEIWGYVSNGLFQSDEEAAAADQSQLYGGQWYAGDVKFEDLDGDGRITRGSQTVDDSGDMRIIGNNTPRYQFGLTAGFEYKGFDFEMFWQGVGKRDYWLGGAQFFAFTSKWDVPYTPSLDYWTEENRGGYFPRIGWQNGGNRTTSTRYLQSAAYGRLKNLTVGYTIPKNITTKWGISRLRVYVTGENLVTITPLSDAFDPETLGNMTYPLNRKVAVGLNLTL